MTHKQINLRKNDEIAAHSDKCGELLRPLHGDTSDAERARQALRIMSLMSLEELIEIGSRDTP